jgi:uncharacterized membrane protein affecting hemolysin expression
MINSGTGYQKNALSGFARLSAQEQQRETANKQMDQQQTASEVGMGMSAAMLIATVASMVIEAA